MEIITKRLENAKENLECAQDQLATKMEREAQDLIRSAKRLRESKRHDQYVVSNFTSSVTQYLRAVEKAEAEYNVLDRLNDSIKDAKFDAMQEVGE